ncbi:MAG: ribonuclease H family protein [Bacteroidales bacterium]|nr:ribonuclease H family protein [Bacteroidales bacterium]
MGKQKKYYVVWVGRKTGIFSSWEECKQSVEKFENAKYKSFPTKEEAEKAYSVAGYDFHAEKKKNNILKTETAIATPKPYIINAIAVDAACSGNPGVMEYQGVYIKTGQRLFHYKAPLGTNNIGEFLAIAHGLWYLKKHSYSLPLYSDSYNAIKWIKEKRCKTKLELNAKTKDLFDYIHRAEHWLETNTYTTQILKWETEHWGEIPADFNRKK